ncbi:MAG: DUF1353 domain-containing protein [Desulfobacterales bacterium]|nr:DUF1353 domain-containing protein [Desulfobacterales bacterium]
MKPLIAIEIYGMPETRVIDYKYSELTKDFVFFHSALGRVVIPNGFTMDWESVPLLKGTSKVGGLIHDYLCRIDSVPVVTKKVAANIYLDIMKFRGVSWWRRYVKYWIVRAAPRYFHKMKVLT